MGVPVYKKPPGRSKAQKVHFEKIAESGKFKELMFKKKRFIVPTTIFFLLFYFTLPFLSSYTNVLEKPAIGDISWAWLLALAQFVMTWTLVTIYMKKSSSFDKMAEGILQEAAENGGKQS